jgi:Uma2 family endonuclease
MSSDVITKKLFTVDEFQLMGEVGILPKTRRHELIHGEIVEVPIPGSAHAAGVKRLNQLFASRIGPPVIISVQDPVRLNSNSATIPDLALLRPRANFYSDAHPVPADVLLLVEVADSTAQWDSTVKADLYAESGILEYWLLDINKDILVVHRHPEHNAYQDIGVYRRGQTVVPEQVNVEFTIDEILGGG